MSALDNLKVATPCPMKWSQMPGDDRMRTCGRCRLNVYNLSAMTTRAATELIAAKGGDLCVKFVRRSDGTVITQDCRGGFSERFWERVGSIERMGSTLFLSSLFPALLFAVVALFGDNIKMLFGRGTVGALTGTTAVTKRLPAAKHERR